MNNENQNQPLVDNQPPKNNLEQVINIPSEPDQSSAIRSVAKISAWVLILSAVLFALIAIAAIWGVFGNNSNAAWKSAASFGLIALAALVVNIGTRIYEGKRK